MPKKKVSKKRSWPGLEVWAIGAASIVSLVFLVMYSVSAAKKRDESQVFRSLKSQLESANSIGPLGVEDPIMLKINNYCALTSSYFSDGPPYCVVELAGNYKVSSLNEAKELAGRVKQNLLDNVIRLSEEGSKADKEENGVWERSSVLKFQQSPHKFTVDCRLEFNYRYTGEDNPTTRPGREQLGTLGYSVYCSETTRALYY